VEVVRCGLVIALDVYMVLNNIVNPSNSKFNYLKETLSNLVSVVESLSKEILEKPKNIHELMNSTKTII